MNAPLSNPTFLPDAWYRVEMGRMRDARARMVALALVDHAHKVTALPHHTEITPSSEHIQNFDTQRDFCQHIEMPGARDYSRDGEPTTEPLAEKHLMEFLGLDSGDELFGGVRFIAERAREAASWRDAEASTRVLEKTMATLDKLQSLVKTLHHQRVQELQTKHQIDHTDHPEIRAATGRHEKVIAIIADVHRQVSEILAQKNGGSVEESAGAGRVIPFPLGRVRATAVPAGTGGTVTYMGVQPGQ